jgi:uncharacterized membrane protein
VARDQPGAGRLECGVILFLLLICLWMTSLNAEQICRRFIEEDESAPVVVVIVTAAALLSLVAISAMLSTIKQVSRHRARRAHELLAALTIVDSWLLVPTIFTVQYADMFYSATGRNGRLHVSEDVDADILGFRVFFVHDRRGLPDRRCRDDPAGRFAKS